MGLKGQRVIGKDRALRTVGMTSTCTSLQLAPAHPISSPVPVAAASQSPGPVIWTMTVGTALMSQPPVVRGTAGGLDWCWGRNTFVPWWP